MAVSPSAARAAAPPRRSPGHSAGTALRYLVFGRALPAAAFGLMGWLQLQRVGSRLHGAASAAALATDVLPYLLYALFCAIPAGIYLTRPAPQARDGRLVARAAAFGGTCMQLVIGAFVPAGPLLVHVPTAVGYLGVVLTTAAWGFAVWGLLSLRRCLSIIPEARRVVTSGPYRLVRHPLYGAEITAAVALTFVSPHLVPALALLVFVGLQVVRTRFEERLLSSALDGYAAYAARTRRLIPFVW